MEELILKEKEFRQNIEETINNSNLPAFIIRPIVKELLEQICIAETQQYNLALKNKQEREEKKEEKSDEQN